MCSHREGETSAPRALGREQKYKMTWSLFRCTLLWGELLTESSLLKKLNANDIPRYIQTSRIPNSGDGVKCPKKHSCTPSSMRLASSERKAGSSSGVTYDERE